VLDADDTSNSDNSPLEGVTPPSGGTDQPPPADAGAPVKKAAKKTAKKATKKAAPKKAASAAGAGASATEASAPDPDDSVF